MNRQNKRAWLRVPVRLALMFALAACGGGGGGGGTSGAGDVSPDYYPVTIGSLWAYDITSSDSPDLLMDELLVSGTRLVSGETAVVFTESNPADRSQFIDHYYLKTARAFTFLGSSAGVDWLTQAMGRFDLMRFDGSFGSTPLVNRSGVDLGQDFDGDGRSERLDLRVTGTVEGYETRSTAAGTFSNTARVRYNIAGTVLFSSGPRVPVNQTVYDWRAPDVGTLRQSITTTVDGNSLSNTLELRGLSVNGVLAGVLPPHPLASGLASASSDETRPGPAALVWGDNRFMLVSNRQTDSGRQWFVQWISASAAAQGTLDLSAPLADLAGPAAAAFDGSNYLVVLGSSAGLQAQRVSAAGALLDAYPGLALSADGFSPAIAYGGGSYLVVYHRSALPTTLFGRRVFPDGTVGGEFVINTGVVDSALPAVAFDGENFLVAWATGLSPQGTDLRAARVSPTGLVLDVVPMVVSAAPEAQTAPQIACDPVNCLISWVDRRNYPGQPYNFWPGPGDLYGSFISRAGLVLNPNGLALATGISANGGQLALAFSGADYLLAWSRGAFVNNPGGPTGIYATRVSPSGSVAPGAPGLRLSGPPADATSLRHVVMAASSNGALVAWLNNTELAGSSKSLAGALVHPMVTR